MPECDVIVIDEAHGCAGSRYYHRLMEQYNNVPTIGLSATPFARGLGKKYSWGQLFEKMVVATTIRELIDEGFLVDVEIYAPTVPDLNGVRIVAGDYDEKQLADVMDQPKLRGDIVSHWMKLANGKSTVVFATNIPHSKHIVEQFRGAGVLAEHIDYHADDETRRDVLGRFERGEITVISNASLLSEGWDAPIAECMVLARPTKSLIRYIQMAGRILRPHHGKERALILDHSATCKELGFPTDDLPLELDDGKPKKSSSSKKQEKLPSICAKCAALKKPGVHACHVCGFAPEKQSAIEVGNGELEIVSRKFTHDDKQGIYSALLTIKQNKGYLDGWVSHKYRAMTGVWPRGMKEIPGPMIETVRKWFAHEHFKSGKASKPKQTVACPRCKSTSFSKHGGVGPHHMQAVCNSCSMKWWLAKEVANA